MTDPTYDNVLIQKHVSSSLLSLPPFKKCRSLWPSFRYVTNGAFVESVNSTQFLDRFQCGNSKLHFCRLHSVNALCALRHSQCFIVLDPLCGLNETFIRVKVPSLSKMLLETFFSYDQVTQLMSLTVISLQWERSSKPTKDIQLVLQSKKHTGPCYLKEENGQNERKHFENPQKNLKLMLNSTFT